MDWLRVSDGGEWLRQEALTLSLGQVTCEAGDIHSFIASGFVDECPKCRAVL